MRWFGGALSHIVTGILASKWSSTKECVCNEPQESDNNTHALPDEFASEEDLSLSASYVHKQSNGSPGEPSETPDDARSNKDCKNQDDQDEEEPTPKATHASNLLYGVWTWPLFTWPLFTWPLFTWPKPPFQDDFSASSHECSRFGTST